MTMQANAVSTPSGILNRQRESFERVKDDILAVPSDSFVTINLDVYGVSAIALGTAGYLEELRPRIELLAHEVDVPRLFKLKDYVYALQYTDAQHLFATTPRESLPALHEEGLKHKDLLLTSALALDAHGLLPNDRVTQIKNPSGYKDLSAYLLAIATVFEDHWPSIVGKTAVTIEQVNHALTLSEQLMISVSERTRAPLNASDTALLRQQAFTLVVKTYQEVRDVVAFLRRKEGDLDLRAPSIYTSRNTASPKPKVTPPAAQPVVVTDIDAPVQPISAVPTGHPDRPPFGDN